jgi:hypothetical protein
MNFFDNSALNDSSRLKQQAIQLAKLNYAADQLSAKPLAT